MNHDDRVRELLDAHDIEQLMIHYIDRIDANDPHGAAECFTSDGIGIYWGEYQGHAAIAERLTGILDGFTATSHHLTNVQPVVTGDTATSLAYVYAFHRRTGSGDWLHVWGRWIDELRRENGQWRFARREVALVGSMLPGDTEHDRAHPGHPGRLVR